MSDNNPPVERQAAACNPPSPSQFDVLMKEYGNTLKDEIKQTSNDLEAKITLSNTASSVVCTERKINDKFARSVKEYNFLSNCITVLTTQDLDGLVNTYTNVLKPKGAAAKTAFDAAVAAIKTVKQKVGQVSSLSVKLRDAIADSCNSEELKQIRECLSKSGQGKRNIEDSVQEFVQLADQIVNQADDTAQAAVKVAGINAFVNLDNLSALLTTAKTDGGKLIADVEANVKDAQKKYDESRKPLGDALKALSTATTDKYKAWDLKDAVAGISKFVDEKNCNTGGCAKLDDISEEAENAYNSEHCGSCDHETPAAAADEE
jgi:hypothetical protein